MWVLVSTPAVQEQVWQNASLQGWREDHMHPHGKSTPKRPWHIPGTVGINRGGDFAPCSQVLSKYRSGKLPKAFKIIPALSNWEQILYVTEPEAWTAAAMYQATR